MTDEKTEQTLRPSKCLCEASDIVVTHDFKPDRTQGYRVRCIWCNRSAAWQKTSAEAIADWNRQTAAPDLLALAKAYLEYKNDYTKLHPAELWDMALAAIAKAEPKS